MTTVTPDHDAAPPYADIEMLAPLALPPTPIDAGDAVDRIDAAPITVDEALVPPVAPITPGGSWPRRLWRGRPEDAAWVRPSLMALLAATSVLYLWGLSASGWANAFYSAAVQAGASSWKALFFGSSDAASYKTIPANESEASGGEEDEDEEQQAADAETGNAGRVTRAQFAGLSN